mmetsp:Transcript_12637/g.19133  ORF Transcript_12637/g.19133 Transcript_12637/m.19133 type:complete len:113 (+) Transcript_12637:347-685(+)
MGHSQQRWYRGQCNRKQVHSMMIPRAYTFSLSSHFSFLWLAGLQCVRSNAAKILLVGRNKHSALWLLHHSSAFWCGLLLVLFDYKGLVCALIVHGAFFSVSVYKPLLLDVAP